MRHSRAAFAILFALLSLPGCGINPVTGARELQLVSSSQEIELGRKNYLPAQQSQGGIYTLDPDLVHYVREVGNRIARISDRPDLPYEFTVLNNSIPNAWAMPGGKIAVNRGLLTALDNEAELAAVLGHEIVHAAARHGAKGVERGLLLQAGVAGIGLATSSAKYADWLVGGAAIGAGLIKQSYSREQEMEADYYGMQYLHKAGYSPKAAVSLQEKFVKLNAGHDRTWLAGLFASHPPSPERVEANRQTEKQLPLQGEAGRERYQQRIAALVRDKPAYEAYDIAVAALGKEDSATAEREIERALRLQPKEALFHGLKGDIFFLRRQLRPAAEEYRRAIALNDGYYRFHQQLGLVQKELGEKSAARESLALAHRLLPTANSAYALGMIARQENRRDEAHNFLNLASQSDSATGILAKQELTAMILEHEPEKIISAGFKLMDNGYLAILIGNKALVPLKDLQVRVMVSLDRTKKIEDLTINVPLAVAPGENYRVILGRKIDRESLPRLSVSHRVLRASAVTE